MATTEDKSVPRLEIRLDPELRRLIRMAAALADMNGSEWVRDRLEQAARTELEKGGITIT